MSENRANLVRSLAIDPAARGPMPGRGGRCWLAFVLGLMLAGGVAAGGYFWWLRPLELVAAALPVVTDPSPATATPAPPPRSGDLVASGYVVARRKATVAAEVTGKVAEVMIEEGVAVTAGQVLARLDSMLAESDLALARSREAGAGAALAAVEADLREAGRVLGRTRELSARNVASTADLTKAESRLSGLQAQKAKAAADIVTTRLDSERAALVLDKYLIRAPFAGMVVDRSAQPGEMISPLSAGGGFTRTGICTLVDMGSLEIEVEVNEAFIGRVRPGQRVEAVLDAYPGWTLPAAVLAVVPTANRDKATVKVRITLRQKDPRILPDMAVKVTVLDSGSETGVSATPPPALPATPQSINGGRV